MSRCRSTGASAATLRRARGRRSDRASSWRRVSPFALTGCAHCPDALADDLRATAAPRGCCPRTWRCCLTSRATLSRRACRASRRRARLDRPGDRRSRTAATRSSSSRRAVRVAQRSVLVSTFVVHQPERVFATLARATRRRARPGGEAVRAHRAQAGRHAARVGAAPRVCRRLRGEVARHAQARRSTTILAAFRRRRRDAPRGTPSVSSWTTRWRS